MGYYCNICKEDITRGEFAYSMDTFGRALCREHQELERRSQKNVSQSEGVEHDAEVFTNTDESDFDKISKIGRKSLGKKLVVKMGKSVVKGVKRVAESSKKRSQIRKWKRKILRRMKTGQLKRFCFEEGISTKKSVLEEDHRSDEVYWKKVDCSQDNLVSRLRNRVSLNAIVNFSKRNHIDIRDILIDIERKKTDWEKENYIENDEEKDLSPEQRWRIAVLTRDKHTCRVCGKVGNSAHHIYSRKYCQKNQPDLEWDIRNGITACYECHKKITLDGRKWFKENDNINR